MRDISEIPTQDLLLELIRRTEYRDLPGEKIALDLDNNRPLWRTACIWIGLGPAWEGCLVPIRDLDQEDINFYADELYIVSSGQDDEKLLSLVKNWGPTDMDWLPEEHSAMMLGGGWMVPNGKGGHRSPVLRAWWS